tara:strand:- start:103 stop:552 length:450 start_codon:yes stop_codon:yes gene_type:complete
MSLIGLIDKIPLYSTLEEAEIWSKQYNLTGYHTHVLKGVLGYMGGATHAQIRQALIGGVKTLLSTEDLALGQFVVTVAEREAYKNINQTTPRSLPVQIVGEDDAAPVIIQNVQTTPTPTPMASPAPPVYTGGSSGSGGSSSGGGGGGGY